MPPFVTESASASGSACRSATGALQAELPATRAPSPKAEARASDLPPSPLPMETPSRARMDAAKIGAGRFLMDAAFIVTTSVRNPGEAGIDPGPGLLILLQTPIPRTGCGPSQDFAGSVPPGIGSLVLPPDRTPEGVETSIGGLTGRKALPVGNREGEGTVSACRFVASPSACRLPAYQDFRLVLRDWASQWGSRRAPPRRRGRSSGLRPVAERAPARGPVPWTARAGRGGPRGRDAPDTARTRQGQVHRCSRLRPPVGSRSVRRPAPPPPSPAAPTFPGRVRLRRRPPYS